MEPRYQCLSISGVWTWRLLCSNHRELARALTRFATQQEAAEDALAMGRLARTAPIDVLLEADTSWRWILQVDGEPRVGSAVHYARRPECLRAIARYRESAPDAVVAPTPLIRRAASGRAVRPSRRGTGQSTDEAPADRSALYRDLHVDVRGRADRRAT